MSETDKAHLREALRLVQLVANNNALAISDAIMMGKRGESREISEEYKCLAVIPNAENALLYALRK